MKQTNAKLSSNGIKPTYQRMRILKFLHQNRTHPTADTIYRELLKDIPTISRTTVYNTLKKLNDRGMVAMLTITGNEARFDSETAPHHHFLCEKCGAIIDIDVRCPLADKMSVGGHTIKEIHGYFKGVCSRCVASVVDAKKGESPHEGENTTQ